VRILADDVDVIEFEPWIAHPLPLWRFCV